MNIPSPKNYGPSGEAIDVFAKGRKEFYSYGENLMQNVRNWKKLAIISSITCLFCVGITGYLSMRSQYIPYLVRIDSKTGFTEAVGPINQVSTTANEAEIKYFLSQVILKTRSIPLDPIVYNSNWSEAAAFLSTPAFGKMQSYAKADKSVQKIGSSTVTPIINGITRLANTSNTYQVRWSEKEFSLQGTEQTIKKYIGTVTVEQKVPEDEASIYKNPLGLIITDISFNTENIGDKDEK